MDTAPGILALDPDSGQPFPVSPTLCLSLCGADAAAPEQSPASAARAPGGSTPRGEAWATGVHLLRGRDVCGRGEGRSRQLPGENQLWFAGSRLQGVGPTATRAWGRSPRGDPRPGVKLPRQREGTQASRRCRFLLTFCVLVPLCTFWEMFSISAATRAVTLLPAVLSQAQRRPGVSPLRGIVFTFPTKSLLSLRTPTTVLRCLLEVSSAPGAWNQATVVAGLSVSRSNLRADSRPDGKVETADAASSQSKRVGAAPAGTPGRVREGLSSGLAALPPRASASVSTCCPPPFPSSLPFAAPAPFGKLLLFTNKAA